MRHDPALPAFPHVESTMADHDIRRLTLIGRQGDDHIVANRGGDPVAIRTGPFILLMERGALILDDAETDRIMRAALAAEERRLSGLIDLERRAVVFVRRGGRILRSSVDFDAPIEG